MPKDPDMLEEYDFSQGVQGKYAHRFQHGVCLVALDQDVAEAFPTDEAVNAALRLVLQLQNLPRPPKRRAPKKSAPAM
jgi:hypothetical protein